MTGHTDPIGTEAYNQKLSERRADAVRDYLVSKGVPKDKIEAIGVGEKQPVAGLVCDQKNLKEKIACLQPDRRVEVQVKGESRSNRRPTRARRDPGLAVISPWPGRFGARPDFFALAALRRREKPSRHRPIIAVRHPLPLTQVKSRYTTKWFFLG